MAIAAAILRSSKNRIFNILAAEGVFEGSLDAAIAITKVKITDNKLVTI